MNTSKLLILAAVGLVACTADTFETVGPHNDAAPDVLGMGDGGPAADGGSGNDSAMLSDAGDAGSAGDGFDGFTPPPYRRVFITSKDYAASFGGLVAADAICQSVALGASLGGTWAAWLSSSTVSAASRLEHATVPYQLLDGTVVASNWTGLVSGTLLNPINRDETDTVVVFQDSTSPVSGLVWTGTMSDGTAGTIGFCGSAGCTCNDWTATTGYTVLRGQDDYTTYYWSNADGASNCAIASEFYCIEQF